MTAALGVLPFYLVFALLERTPSTSSEDPVPPDYLLPPVVIEASRSPLPPFPGARTLIDREWLRRRDPSDLGEALTSVAGLRLVSLGDGESHAVSIRGLGPDRTAVLVDGQLRNTAQGGGVDLASWDLEGVERIEIARGAMGALYGPYALGGAIQVVTRRDRDSSSSWQVLAGSQGRAELRGRIGGVAHRWSASAEGGYARAALDLEGTTAHSESGDGTVRLGFRPQWAQEVDLSVEARTDARDVPGSRSFPTPQARRRDTLGQVSLAVHDLRAFAHPGHFDVTLSGFRFQREFADPAYPLGAIDDAHRNDRAAAALDWQGSGSALTPSVRAEAVRDRLVSTTDGDRSRDRAAVAGSVEATRGRWSASAALRLDALEGFAPEGTGRVGITRTLEGTRGGARWTSLRAGAGTSFRPPTFDDLFWPARATAAGNPDLRPERAWDLDLGLEARSGRSGLQLSVYRSEVDDLIQWIPGPDGAWRPHNLGQAILSGVELEGTLHRASGIGDVYLDGALSRTLARDATDDPTTGGMQLVGRSEWIGSGALSWRRGAWGGSWGARGVDRVPLTAANTKWQAGYVLWDASASWRARSGLRLELSGRNLLDTAYEDLRGYATPGREVLFSVRLSTGSEDR